ncbi:hypothetical protein [uncultured Sphingomonas sp.]|uniref:hypothetical protein n=1 Tax=uncultured Sphingomonas sp. TaxID=158754 RepID=UPI0035CAC41D
MNGFLFGAALVLLAASAMLWFNPERALRNLRVDFTGSFQPSPWYRVGSILLLLMAISLILTSLFSE